MAARKVTAPDDLWQSFKRQGIQQAVIQLMCREGLGSVTMDRVAQEAGIAKGTIYLHYRDKQELLDDVKNSSLDPMIAKMEEIFRGDASPDRKLQTYSLRYLAYFDERRDLFRILLYEREVTRVQSSRYQGDRYRRLVEGTARVIRDGIDRKTFRDVHAEGVAAMFVDSNLAIMNQRLLTESPRPVEDDAQLIADLFVNGLKRRGK
ncbi:MAG TPA: TetR/AcrR family transcriptional regulator [Thermoanaerobaculia bacterium]|nr:TetR/AcrR family transcriptional regulator [Thermoanaerobaculia bacterium]